MICPWCLKSIDKKRDPVNGRPNTKFTKYAYTAGFFDGEGTVHIRNSRSKSGTFPSSVTVSIGNTDLLVLEKFKEWWGGYIGASKKKDNRRQFYVWYCVGKEAYKFLKNIWPYSQTKRSQISLAIEFKKKRVWHGRIMDKFTTKISDEEIELRKKIKQQLSDLRKYEYPYIPLPIVPSKQS